MIYSKDLVLYCIGLGPFSLINTLRKSLQTASTSPCRTQVQPAASFLVCSLIFIEYKTHDVSAFPSGHLSTFFI